MTHKTNIMDKSFKMDNSPQLLLSLPLSSEIPNAQNLPALMVPESYGSAPQYPISLYRLYYARSGKVDVNIAGQIYPFDEGKFLALAPEETESWKGDADLCSLAFHHSFFCVHMKQDAFFCDGIVFNRSQGSPICQFPDNAQNLLINQFEEIRQIIKVQTAFTEARTISTLQSMLLQAAEYKLNDISSNQDDELVLSKKSELTSRFEYLLELHYKIRHDVQFYAETLNVTPARLNRRLNKELGKTTSNLIHERIALEARRELRTGTKSIKEVAFLLGFEDQLYFSRFFRKQFGLSPSKYFDQKPK